MGLVSPEGQIHQVNNSFLILVKTVSREVKKPFSQLTGRAHTFDVSARNKGLCPHLKYHAFGGPA